MRIPSLVGPAVVSLVVACGSSPVPTRAAVSASTASTPDLSNRVLTVRDLPPGWSVDNSPSTSTATVACLPPITNPDILSRAEARFKGGANGVPALGEKIGAFSGDDRAHQALSRAESVAAGCRTFTFSSSGHTFSGTLAAMSLPTLGDESDAYQVVLTTSDGGATVTLGFDILIFRTAALFGLLTYFDLGTPDVATFQGFAEKAVDKL